MTDAGRSCSAPPPPRPSEMADVVGASYGLAVPYAAGGDDARALSAI